MNAERDLRIHSEHQVLTPEELSEWRSCVRNSFFFGGLPFAFGVHFVSKFFRQKGMFKNVLGNQTGMKPAAFVGNVFVGIILYLPVCAKQLKQIILAKQQKLKERQEGFQTFSSEGGGSLKDDVNFQSSLDPGLDGPNTNFSHLDLEIDSSFGDKVILENVEDEKSKQSIPTTTYDDLRKHNRENFSRQSFRLPVRDITRPANYSSLDTPKPTQSETPPKRIIRNKYGDEIEI